MFDEVVLDLLIAWVWSQIPVSSADTDVKNILCQLQRSLTNNIKVSNFQCRRRNALILELLGSRRRRMRRRVGQNKDYVWPDMDGNKVKRKDSTVYYADVCGELVRNGSWNVVIKVVECEVTYMRTARQPLALRSLDL